MLALNLTSPLSCKAVYVKVAYIVEPWSSGLETPP